MSLPGEVEVDAGPSPIVSATFQDGSEYR